MLASTNDTGKNPGVFSCLHRGGVRFVLVQGGEPLLRRDLTEILEALSAIGFHLMLITSGMKVEPQITGLTGSKGRTGRGTVIGKTMSIILRSSTVPIALTVPEAGETGRTGGPSFLSERANPAKSRRIWSGHLDRTEALCTCHALVVPSTGSCGAWVAGGLNFHTEGGDDEDEATRNQ
jgi:hypothetical protein